MNPAWTVDRLYQLYSEPVRKQAEANLQEHWRLRRGHTLHADVFVHRDGRVSWTVGRRGELGTRWRWDRFRHLENARLDAEAALEDLPVYGPLPADAFEPVQQV